MQSDVVTKYKKAAEIVNSAYYMLLHCTRAFGRWIVERLAVLCTVALAKTKWLAETPSCSPATHSSTHCSCVAIETQQAH